MLEVSLIDPDRVYQADAPDIDPVASERALAQISLTAISIGGAASKKAYNYNGMWDISPSFISFTLAFASSAGVVQLIRSSGKIMTQWLNNKATRRIIIKSGDIRIELQGYQLNGDEVDRLIERVNALSHRKEVNKSRSSKKDNRPTD